MNYNLNNLRGICIFFVLYIHTISFLFSYEQLNYIQQYFYSLSSLCVPLLFMLSGYLYYFSKNQVQRTIKLLKKYLILALITYFFNLSILGMHSRIIYIFTFNASSIGYLWFIKLLIYLQLIVIGFKYNWKILIFIIFMMIASLQNVNPQEIIYYSVCYFTAFIIARYKEVICHYVPSSLVIAVFCLPILLNELYFSYRMEIVLFVSIIFIFTLKIKSNHEIKALRIFSTYSSEFLFFQYFIIELIIYLHPRFNSFYTYFILFTSLTTLSVYIYSKLNQKFKEELLNISTN